MELRRTSQEPVPHVWAAGRPHLEVVTVARSLRGGSVEVYRIADLTGDSGGPTWVRYDPWVWTMRREHAGEDPFVAPLVWPE